MLTIAGPLLLIYGIILFDRTNKLTPKVSVDDTGILIKEDMHRSPRKIDWSSVREINYKPFELIFHLTDHTTETVNLTANGEISLEVKKMIKQFAADRQIKLLNS